MVFDAWLKSEFVIFCIVYLTPSGTGAYDPDSESSFVTLCLFS